MPGCAAKEGNSLDLLCLRTHSSKTTCQPIHWQQDSGEEQRVVAHGDTRLTDRTGTMPEHFKRSAGKCHCKHGQPAYKEEPFKPGRINRRRQTHQCITHHYQVTSRQRPELRAGIPALPLGQYYRAEVNHHKK